MGAWHIEVVNQKPKKFAKHFQRREGDCKKKSPNLNLRFLETLGVGGLKYLKNLNYKLFSDPIQKRNIKTLNLPIFNEDMPKYDFYYVRPIGSATVN